MPPSVVLQSGDYVQPRFEWVVLMFVPKGAELVVEYNPILGCSKL